MSDPWATMRERVEILKDAERTGADLSPRDFDLMAFYDDADTLLAVVKVTQTSLGMSVPELLRIVAKDIETDSEIEAVDVLAMWLRRLADELEKTLAALSEHLR